MQIKFVEADGLDTAKDGVAALVFEGGALSAAAKRLDELTDGGVARAIKVADFTGAKGKSLQIIAPAGLKITRILLVGAGAENAFDAKASETAAAEAYLALKTSGVKTLRLGWAGFTADHGAHAALGLRLASYRFDRYRTTEKADRKPTIELVEIAVTEVKAAKAADKPLAALANGVIFTRDLVSEPANILYPAEFAKRVKALESMGLTVEILGVKEMTKLGMGSLLGVGQGSARESQLAVIQWKGADDPKAQPVAFVGKGVCFDTGGISIKGADGMEDMKWDMGGRRRRCRPDAHAGRSQGQGQRRRHPGPGGKHARRQCATARGRGNLHVRPDHRGDQHRRRGPPGFGRRALVLPGPVPAQIHDRPGDADRRHHYRPG